ncbi:probable rRNA maturation factor [Candidatus Moduliflexus flocculans]|uniref:Endoribonuclease YbeY n=1 Tax=Candidatus Moduliflexus flocculans TaxID=1499966 RepID=A0A0S6VTS5_9BACT|nr:probable rRNA maturation factor [Candidatus Moduliflexus flocculans]
MPTKNDENQKRMNILLANNQQSYNIDLSQLRRAAQWLLTAMQCEERCEVSITLVCDDAMHVLNRQYRGIDRPTDVLSFAFQEAREFSPSLVEMAEQPLALGDIIISTDTAQRQADERGHSLEREIWILLIHGMLHLLGYDHESDEDAEEMEALERQLLDNILQAFA